MLMILARLVRSESFWAVAKVRSPHTGPGISYIIKGKLEKRTKQRARRVAWWPLCTARCSYGPWR